MNIFHFLFRAFGHGAIYLKIIKATDRSYRSYRIGVYIHEFAGSRVVIELARAHEPRVSARVRITTRNIRACVIQSPRFELVCFLAECFTLEAIF